MTRALVTGAGQGVGRDMAIYLAQRGFQVALHCTSPPDQVEHTADLIRSVGAQAHVLPSGAEESIPASALLELAAAVLAGQITCFINASAATPQSGADASSSIEDVDLLLRKVAEDATAWTHAMGAQGLIVLRDAQGEARASGLIVHFIPLDLPVGMGPSMTRKLVEMGLWNLTRTGAEMLAPAIRVNAIGLGAALQGGRKPPADPSKPVSTKATTGRNVKGDLTATLGYILEAPAVTGQLFCIDVG